MRLLATTAGTLGLCLMLFLTIRFWGLSQRYQAFEHPFLNGPPTELAVKIQSEKDALEARSLAPQVIFWLDVRMSLDEQLFIQPKGLLEPYLSVEKQGPEHFRGEKPYFYNLENLKIYFPELPLLRTFLQNFPHQKMILNIQDNAQNIHIAIEKLVDELKADPNLLIQSDVDVILKTLKDERPTWIYGTSSPELTRILTLESIGLEMAPTIRADVWVTPMKLKDRNVFKESLLEEVHRRHKKVFLTSLSQKADFLDAQRYKLDGLVFDKIESLKEFLSQAKSP